MVHWGERTLGAVADFQLCLVALEASDGSGAQRGPGLLGSVLSFIVPLSYGFCLVFLLSFAM